MTQTIFPPTGSRSQEVEMDAQAIGAEAFLPEVFCTRVIESLIEIGEIEEAVSCSHRAHGVQVSGYGIEDGDVLNLISVDYAHGESASKIGKRDCDTLIKRLERFWELCRDETYHERLEESSDAWDMALDIHERAAGIRRVDCHLFTNRIAPSEFREPEKLNGVELRAQVWDLERLRRLDHEGTAEPIRIDLVAELGAPLPVLSRPRGGRGFSSLSHGPPRGAAGEHLCRVWPATA